ncbi:MAG: hypothetical protein ACRC3J_01830 [Culicoidibacterales bacterium]
MFRKNEIISVVVVDDKNASTKVTVCHYYNVLGFKFGRKRITYTEAIYNGNLYWYSDFGLMFDVKLAKLLDNAVVLQSRFERAKPIN